MSHVTCQMLMLTLGTFHMSLVICEMLMLILGTYWTTFVLISMLKREYLCFCHMPHVTCHMSNAYVDPWDMLNNFCFMSIVKSWCLLVKMTIFFWTTGPLPVSDPVIEIPGYLFFQKCPKNNLKAREIRKNGFFITLSCTHINSLKFCGRGVFLGFKSQPDRKKDRLRGR